MKIKSLAILSLLLIFFMYNVGFPQWLITNDHAWIQMDQNDTHTINGTTFKCWGNNTECVYINIDGATSPHTIYKYNVRKYNSEALLVVIEESSVNWGFVSFGSSNSGYVSFAQTTITCNPGDRIQFNATSSAVLTESSPDIYQNATVKSWCDYNGVIVGSGGHSATYFFDVPSNYTGSQYFYMGVHLSPGNTKFVQYLRIISVAPTEEISVPGTPNGFISGKVGQSLVYSTGGAVSSLGHPVEYQFDWGDGNQSAWGSATQSYSYSNSGTFNIKARARCQTHTSVVSDWSNSISVTISYYTLAINISPSGAGSVSKNPDRTGFTYNESVQLTANANSGYQFNSWSGDLSGSINPQNLTMNGDKSVTANFLLIETISIPTTPTGPSSGKVGQSLSFSTGGSSSNLGHTVEYQFDWGDGTQSNWGAATQSHSYSSSGTKYVLARARCQTHTSIVSGWSNSKSAAISFCTLTINVSPSGSGNVSKNPNKTDYIYNESAQLTASPNSTYQFSSWSGDFSGSNNPQNITMDGDKTITANFLLIETVSTPAAPTGPSSGKVGQSLSFSTSGSNSNLGHSVEYQFDWGDGTQSNWGAATQSHSYGSSGTKYVLARARCQTHTSIVSSWSNSKSAAISFCTLTININPTGSGIVSKNPNKTDYIYNESVQLTANANSGYQFVSWNGDLSGSSNPQNLIMNGDKNVTANIPLIETVSTPATPTGPSSGKVGQSLSFSTSGSNSNLGHSVEYQFDWGDGSQSNWGAAMQSHSYNSPGTKYITARARCQIHTSILSSWSNSKSVTISYCTLTIHVSPSGSGNVTKNPNKTDYTYNESVQLTATPNSTYHFSSWSGDLSGNSNPQNINMNGDKSITANFTQIIETVSTPTTPTGPPSGKVGQSLSFSTGGASSNLGHTVEYQFDWGDGNQSDWGTSTRVHSYSSTGTKYVKAHARCQTHTGIVSTWSNSKSLSISFCSLTIDLSPPASGSVTKNPNKIDFNYNETVQLIVNANSGFQFDHWGGDLNGNNNPHNLNMNGDKSVTAYFVSSPYLTISPNNIIIGFDENSQGSFSISSNVNWTISDTASWLTFAPTSGFNDGTVTATATSANTSTNSRSATVTVSGSGVSSQTVTVTQAASNVTRIIRLVGNLDFGNVLIDSTSEKNLTIFNDGNSKLTGSSIICPSGFDASWSGEIEPGGKHDVIITFNPKDSIDYSGVITVNSDKTSGNDTIACSGIGTIPVMLIPVVQDHLLYEEFDVDILVKDVQKLFGVAFKFNFPPDKLTAVSADTGNFLGKEIIFFPDINNTSGSVSIGISKKSGQSCSNGAGILAKIKLKEKVSVAAGEIINLSLTEIAANDSLNNPIGIIPKDTLYITPNSTSELTVQPKNISIGPEVNSTGSFEIISNINWSISTNVNWLTISPVSGSNNARILITVGIANNSINSREAKLFVSGNGLLREVIVTQAGIAPNDKFILPIVQDHSLHQEFNVDIQVKDVENLFGLAFKLNFPADKLEALSAERGDFLGTDPVFFPDIDNNTGVVSIGISIKKGQPAANGAGVVTRIKLKEKPFVTSGITIDLLLTEVSGMDPLGNVLKLTPQNTSYITPGPTVTLEVSPASLTLGSVVNSQGIFSINSNVMWSVSKDADWMTVSPLKDSGNATITVTATSSNSLASSRSATVTVSGGGINRTVSIVQSPAQNRAPDIPQLLTPIKNSNPDTNQPVLVWNVPKDDDNDLLHFKVEIATDNGFINMIYGSPFESQNKTTSFSPTPPLGAGKGLCSFTVPFPLIDGEYYWRVTAWDGTNYGIASSVWKFVITKTEVERASSKLLNEFALFPNYPNPFNPETTISYKLSKPCYVRIEIFDLNGRVVKTLINTHQDHGIHSLIWDATDDDNKLVSSGIYICRLNMESAMLQRKIILTR